jgi:hypothetical protein
MRRTAEAHHEDVQLTALDSHEVASPSAESHSLDLVVHVRTELPAKLSKPLARDPSLDTSQPADRDQRGSLQPLSTTPSFSSRPSLRASGGGAPEGAGQLQSSSSGRQLGPAHQEWWRSFSSSHLNNLAPPVSQHAPRWQARQGG